MKNTYPKTYQYILESIELNQVHCLSSFNQSQREEILRLFISEATPLRLEELNEDYMPELPLEVAFLHPDNQSLRAKAVDIVWDKYDAELDKIFDQAECDEFKANYGMSEYEEWRHSDLRQRCRDAA